MESLPRELQAAVISRSSIDVRRALGVFTRLRVPPALADAIARTRVHWLTSDATRKFRTRRPQGCFTVIVDSALAADIVVDAMKRERWCPPAARAATALLRSVTDDDHTYLLHVALGVSGAVYARISKKDEEPDEGHMST